MALILATNGFETQTSLKTTLHCLHEGFIGLFIYYLCYKALPADSVVTTFILGTIHGLHKKSRISCSHYTFSFQLTKFCPSTCTRDCMCGMQNHGNSHDFLVIDV